MKPKAASLLDVINSPVFTVGLEHVRYRIFFISNNMNNLFLNSKVLFPDSYSQTI